MATRKAKAANSSHTRMQAEMRNLGKRLDELERLALRSEAGLRASTMRQLRVLQKQQASAQRALARFGRQSYAASGPLLAGLQKAWQDVEVSMGKALKAFRGTS